MQKNVLKKLFICHKFDWILGAALLITALCLFLIFKNIEKPGGKVTVKKDNEVVAEYSLDKDGEYEFKSFYGYNKLIIKDGMAWVVDSSCKDHICEKTGKISKVGETIICLPNSLFVTITEGEASDYDAIVR